MGDILIRERILFQTPTSDVPVGGVYSATEKFDGPDQNQSFQIESVHLGCTQIISQRWATFTAGGIPVGSEINRLILSALITAPEVFQSLAATEDFIFDADIPIRTPLLIRTGENITIGVVVRNDTGRVISNFSTHGSIQLLRFTDINLDGVVMG